MGYNSRRRTYRNRDPYWTTARYRSICPQCGDTIRQGARIFYYPRDKAALCGGACGEAGAAALRAEKSMDRFGTDCQYDY